MKLADVVHILPGMPFRSRIETETGGTFAIVQARDLSPEGVVQFENAARLAALPAKPKTYLKVGDIVFQPRGTRFSAAKVDYTETSAIAAAPLFTLRCDASRISPDFLLAVLRSSTTQAMLRQSAVGTYVPQIPRQAIESLHIELPDLPDQIRLADLAHLERRESELMERLREVRERLFDLAVGEAAKKSRKRVNAPGSKPGPSGASTP